MDTNFDRLIDQLESELKSGASPQIESYLQQVLEESRDRLLTELISLEVFYHAKQASQRVGISRLGLSRRAH